MPLPDAVTVAVAGSHVRVTGPKGALEQRFSADLQIAVTDQGVVVTRPSDRREHRAQHGLTRALIHNMVVGVLEGFTKVLEVRGTGYRAELDGETLVLRVGFSHEVRVSPPAGIKLEVEGPLIRVHGIDKQAVGQQAAEIRHVRPPEPYKGKGIRYQGEWVRRKAGKSAVTAGAGA